MPALVPNNPQKRMKWVIDQYWSRGSQVVLDTAQVATFLLGQERNEEWIHAEAMARADGGDTSKTRLLNGLPFLPSRNDFDFVLPWVAQQLARLAKATRDESDRDTYYEAVRLLKQKAPVIAMWAKRERKDLGRVSLQEAFEATADFEVDATGIPQGDVVYTFPDGFTVQELPAGVCLTAEGEAMQHCVGGYDSAVESGRTKIYSLRDKKGGPHVTIEWDVKTRKVRQVKGKQNEAPAPKYQEKADTFLKEYLGVEPLTAKEREILEVLEGHDEWAHGGDAEGTVQDWTWVDDASDVDRWLHAGIWSGSSAESLADAGARPRDVKEMNGWLQEYLAQGGEWNVARIAELLAVYEWDRNPDVDVDDERWQAAVLKEARQWDTAHEFDEVKAWVALGVTEKRYADDWEEIGKPGDETLEAWIEAFGTERLSSADDAAGWFKAGFEPDVAKALDDAHVSVYDAAAAYEPGMSAKDVIAALEEAAE